MTGTEVAAQGGDAPGVHHPGRKAAKIHPALRAGHQLAAQDDAVALG
jgi:hypothetical protein